LLNRLPQLLAIVPEQVVADDVALRSAAQRRVKLARVVHVTAKTPVRRFRDCRRYDQRITKKTFTLLFLRKDACNATSNKLAKVGQLGVEST